MHTKDLPFVVIIWVKKTNICGIANGNIGMIMKMQYTSWLLVIPASIFSVCTIGQVQSKFAGIRVQPPKTIFTGNAYSGNPDSIYERHEWISPAGDTLRYRLLLPLNYDTAKSYPLLLFLHGGGERGSDNTKQLMHGARLFLNPEVRRSYPAIVVFPQCPEKDYWSNVKIKINDTTQQREFTFFEGGNPTRAMELLLNWLPELERTHRIKQDQRYVAGLSMGGMGTFEIVRRKPGFFAAAVPICGGAHPGTAGAIKETAFWMFHGDKDNVVPYQYSERMFEALQEFYVRSEVNFTLYRNTGHNSWDAAFAEPELLPWLFGIVKK